MKITGLSTIKSLLVSEKFPQIEPSRTKEIGSSEQITSGLNKLYNLQASKIDQTAETLYSLLGGPVYHEASLFASTDDQGKVQVKTKDGYKIHFEAQDQAFSITSPSGHRTRIWGDPHVTESDGDTWDFFERSSFIFGDNKITVETVDLGNSKSLSRSVSIYNGDDRFTLRNIDQDDPEFVAWKFDAKAHDQTLEDGEVYQLETQNDKQNEKTVKWFK